MTDEHEHEDDLDAAPDGEPQRLFTLDEANELLSEVVPLLDSLRRAHAEMEGTHDDVMASIPTNGGGPVHRAFVEGATEASRVTARLSDLGIVVRDPATGLIDFPTERDGEIVFLCFRLGEEAIAYWHPTDTGFAGRKPL